MSVEKENRCFIRGVLRRLFFIVLIPVTINAQTYTSGDWRYEISSNEVTITGYTGSGGVVVIPDQIEGTPVLQLGAYLPNVFGWNNSTVTSVEIPNGVRRIGNSTFYSCSALTNVIIPNTVTNIGYNAFESCTALTSLIVPNSVTFIGDKAFTNCISLTNLVLPSTFISQTGRLGLGGTQTESDFMTESIATALATNQAFIARIAQAILLHSNNYGIVTQTNLENTISLAISNLATKTELTNVVEQSRADGINSVLSNPNLWTLYTTNQIKALAIGDLVLTRTNNSEFVLNYDIEQSEDLVNWAPYQGFSMPLTNLPTNKAFVRIKAKQ